MTAPHLATIPVTLPQSVPFVGPETLERQRGKAFAARLGANESGFGPAPSVIAAIADNAASVWTYGDPENHELREAIAAFHGVAPEEIMVGEGVDSLLGLVARLYLDPGDKVVTSLGGYPTFNFHVVGFGGQLVTVPYRDDREDLAGLLEAVRASAPKLVYLANPDNPMGTWWPADEVDAFIAALPQSMMLILDEAYGELAPEGTLPAIDTARANVLRMRTFSKAYGLAGLRCGYAIGHRDAIGAFDRVRNHFGVNKLAQIGALAALRDQDYLETVKTKVASARRRIARIGAANGLMAIISATNFVCLDCGRDGPFAKAVLEGLAARDVFVRKPGVAPMDRCIRVSVGPDAALDVFEAALPGAIADANAQF